MLDYKNIIIKSYVLHMTGREIAESLHVSQSGVNGFLREFKRCKALSFPLPEGITNLGIFTKVYPNASQAQLKRDERYELPDFGEIHQRMTSEKNMTLAYLWGKYTNRCAASDRKAYQYRQFCELYTKWKDDNNVTYHKEAAMGQDMEVDFAGKTFSFIDSLTGEVFPIVVFAAVLPYSQFTYAEGMSSIKEPQWIEVNNNALKYFDGVPAIVVCDNCKQAVISNRDWIEPDLNEDYTAWAEHNGTAIMPARVKKPRDKSSIECAIGIMEKGFFHDLAQRDYFSLEAFNRDLRENIDRLNDTPFTKKPHSRRFYWEEERKVLMQLPSTQYQYVERKAAKSSGDFHIRFDNSYYSVDKSHRHNPLMVYATAETVTIRLAETNEVVCVWPRAKARGQWMTNPDHLPENFRLMSNWNAHHFLSWAMTIGPNTKEVVQRILVSRKLEVQTYRSCQGVLSFSRKYGKEALEECCALALDRGKVSYTTIKNSITAFADAHSDKAAKPKSREQIENRNKGGYAVDTDMFSLEVLLEKSRTLAASEDEEGHHAES